MSTPEIDLARWMDEQDKAERYQAEVEDWARTHEPELFERWDEFADEEAFSELCNLYEKVKNDYYDYACRVA